MIDEILVEDGKVVGVRTATHPDAAKAVVWLQGQPPWEIIWHRGLKYSSGPNHNLASIISW